MKTNTSIMLTAMALVATGAGCFWAIGDGSPQGQASQPDDFDRAKQGVVDHMDSLPRSPFQNELLKDGTLTQEEYDQAFAKFADCVTAAGAVLDGERTKNQWGVYDAGYGIPPIEYGVPNTRARIEADECNSQYFDVVGPRWQASHPIPEEAKEAAFATVPDCMRSKGLRPPADLTRGWSRGWIETHTSEENLLFVECIVDANRSLGMPKSVLIQP
jgi:hypothetical protein